MEREVAGSADVIAEMITLGTDLMFRHLVDRDDLSASAALVLNRISREGPMRLTALLANKARKPASSSRANSASAGARKAARAASFASRPACANLFQGQTARQSSQP